MCFKSLRDIYLVLKQGGDFLQPGKLVNPGRLECPKGRYHNENYFQATNRIEIESTAIENLFRK